MGYFCGSQSINGNIFHTRNFLNYHQPERFPDRSLLFYKKGKLIGLFPAALINAGENKIFKSHPGASYGGLIVKSPQGIQDTLNMVKGIVEYATDDGYQEIGLRIAPKIYNCYPTDEIEFAMRASGFVIDNMELSTCYPYQRF